MCERVYEGVFDGYAREHMRDCVSRCAENLCGRVQYMR